MKFNDSSHGFRRRLRVIKFSQKFEGENRDFEIDEKLLQELPGIFNLAVDGYRRMKDRGDFIESDVMRAEADMLHNQDDHVTEFIKYELDVNLELDSYRSEIIKLYNAFAATNGYPKLTPNALWAASKRHVQIELPSKTVWRTQTGKPDRKVKGIAMKMPYARWI